jgi:ribosomal protein L35AE/L33A
MLTWLDGRNGSSFGTFTWDGTTLGFTVATASGATNIQTMLPASFQGHFLTGLTRGGTAVTYTTQTIKGVSYAVFPSGAGSYQAQYAVDTTPPGISSVSAAPASSTATINWSTNEAATSRVDYGTNPTALNLTASVGGFTGSHSVQLVGLAASTTYYFRVTSADVSSNSATSPVPPNAPASFTTQAPPSLNCPCSIWTPVQVPGVPSVNDQAAVELGLKFRSTSDGFITGIRFYKSAQNTGTHTGSLWTTSGTLLRSLTFTNETASGWQEATFGSPVPVTANTTYVVSYHTDAGFYAGDSGYFQSTGVTNGPLQALANGVSGPNGVYIYGPSAFPTDTFNSANYWVDVVFDTSATIDTTPPTVTTTTPTAGASGVDVASSVSATFSEDVNASTVTGSTVTLRDSASMLVPATVTYASTTRTVTLQPTGGLTNGMTYTARIAGGANGVKDLADNPLAADVVWPFATSPAPALTVADTTAGDFSAGTVGTGSYVSQTNDGEVILAPAAGAEFLTAALPVGWAVTPWNTGSSTAFPNGQFAIDGARASTTATFPAGASLEFAATFSGDTFEHVGFGITFNETPWAMFSTASGGGLYARTHNGTTSTDTLIPGSWLGTPHRYRIDWTSSGVTYSIDGTQVATHPLAIAVDMRPIISDFNIGNGVVTVDWVRMTPYASSGTFTSRVLDAGTAVSWSSATWTAQVPTGTALALSARFGNTAVPDGTWTSFVQLGSSPSQLATSSRYVQYQATLSGNGAGTPTLSDVTFSAPSPGPPTVSLGDVSVTEGNSGTVNAVFALSLSRSSTTQVTVAYATAAGTATVGTDYVTTSGTAVFAPGTTTVNVSVPVVGDTSVEPNETFFLNLSNPVNATISDAQGVATIVNDDAPQLSIGNATATEGNTGSVNATFTVTLSQASTQTVTVNYATANGTATAGADYTTTSGQLTFAPGVTSRTINIPVLGDTLDEPNETFTVTLSGPVNATIATGTGSGTIADNDATPSLAINNVTVTEGNTGTVSAVFTVSLSAASGQTVTVNYATANGTAVAPADYAATSGALTFSPGTTTRQITVLVNGDTLDEASETFNVNLSAATNATIADSQGVGTITDNDTAPTLRINDISIAEGNSGTKTATFTVTLSAASGQSVTVHYATANGSASSSSDYNAASGTLTFAAGTTTQTISVTIRGDQSRESNETFVVNLSAATNATIADSQGVCTILNDD